MTPDGARKAAVLLTWLGPETASALLKEASPDTVTRIAAELTYLDATGGSRQDAAECIREFSLMLKEQQKGEVRGEELVREILESVVGEQKAPELLDQIQEMVLARDPFLQLRSAEAGDIAEALRGEGARVASVVLSELPASKSAELLALLPEELRARALQAIAGGDTVTPETRVRVALIVMGRLQGARGSAGSKTAQGDTRLRKVSLIVRGLPNDIRNSMLEQIAEADPSAGETVARLMVTWEDLPHIGGRALQEVLRSADARELALALCDADEEIVQKIHGNCSERMSALIEEESSLLSSPKPEEIHAAREQILEALREMNATGDLTFEEEQDHG